MTTRMTREEVEELWRSLYLRDVVEFSFEMTVSGISRSGVHFTRADGSHEYLEVEDALKRFFDIRLIYSPGTPVRPEPPDRSIAIDADGYAWQRRGDTWFSSAWLSAPWSQLCAALPGLRVIYTPEEAP